MDIGKGRVSFRKPKGIYSERIEQRHSEYSRFIFYSKLDISPEDDISNETVAKGLVQYISAFEEIMTWQR